MINCEKARAFAAFEAMRRGRVLYFLAVVPCLPLLVAALYWMLQVGVDKGVSTHLESIQGRRENRTLMHNGRGVGPPPPQWGTVPPPSATTITAADRELIAMSEHPDIDIRGKFQKQRMNQLCRRYFFSGEQHFPKEVNLLSLFHRHLMFDDRKKVIFCFVPKIGCTNMKRMMLYMGGRLPLETLDWPWVEDSIYLEPALKHVTFLNKSLSDVDRMRRLHTYYKFMIVRNPFERIVSAYRDKVEHPVIRTPTKSEGFSNMIKRQILMRYRPAELLYWERTAKQHLFNISVTFPEFVRYLIETNAGDRNEHFQPSMHMCHPCLVGYDFYGNFKNYSEDTKLLIQKFNTNPKFYQNKSLHPVADQTNMMMARYYRTLSYRDKVQLLGAWYDELVFYYTLYPAEKDSHRKLLGISQPVL